MLNKLQKYGPVNSHDVLKCAAIVLMVIDHIGFFFFPEQPWLRIIGRLCVPMWFFLVGYSPAKHWFSLPLIIGIAVMVVAEFLLHSPVFPLNILTTILLLRIAHHYILTPYLEDSSPFRLTAVILLILLFYPITFWFTEYGSLVAMFSVCGILARKEGQNPRHLTAFFLVAATLFTLVETVMFEFSIIQALVMEIGLIAVMRTLYSYKLQDYSLRIPKGISASVMLLGRYSLQLYVVHWILFLWVNHYVHPERYLH